MDTAESGAPGTPGDREKSLRALYDAHHGKVSDKWSLYLETYDRIFSDVRNEPIRLLEIGVQNGGSLELWKKYFPRAELILGCDVDPACGMLQFNDENIKVIVGDANTDKTNEEIINISKTFDIIIDDGSHKSSDIVKSFIRYFGYISEGGIYIAEDLHCSYWKRYEGGIYDPLSSMAFFKRLLDTVNHEHWGVDRKRIDALATFSEKYGVTFDESVLASIHSVEFLNSLCVLRKRPQAQNTLGPRRVVGSEALVADVVTKWDGEAAKVKDESGNRWSLLSETMEEEILNGRELVRRHAETVGQLQDELAARRREIQDYEASIAAGDARIDAQRMELAALQQQIAAPDQTGRQHQAVVSQKDKQLQRVLVDLDRAKADIEEIRDSTSWRITRPLRALSARIRQLLRQIEAAATVPRLAVRSLLGSPRIVVFLARRWRERGTKGMISRLRISLRQEGLAGTVATVRRVAFNERRLHLPTVPGESAIGADGPGFVVPRSVAVSEYVPHSKRATSFNPPVRVLAHYLPQFHSIPENDKWWGTGFTEWTNVRPGRPAFPGHYQPHVPDYLGYYDLNDVEVMRRQTEIAKQYGVHGFCFYFYWFAGKTLLEMPLKKFLEDETVEFPYCICWANENWTRRWDGLDSELLIEQHHSPDDDLAFIAHVAQYLRDPRYVRVDGKPLLMVYRPSLLPDTKATALRWRKWCRENGVGEIQLVYTQSFERVDPGNYGFDAASEFPPNNSHIPEVQIAKESLPEGFSGHVYDWSVLVERSDKYDVPGYTLYRAVCPSWDNSPRRGLRASILVNSNPALFGRWLFNAVGQTLSRRNPKQGDIVFVNAWNEWAEGAHLEPDQRYGFAWLEAVRVALVKQSDRLLLSERNPSDDRVAIVVHAFYPDVFEEILDRIEKLPKRHKMFVSTTPDNESEIQAKLDRTGREYVLKVYPNRGRDVLPFMKLYDMILAEGFTTLIKVHTKKSLHRDDGNIWRQELYDALLSNDFVESALATLKGSPDIGMIGPEGHFVSMSTYIGANETGIVSMGRRLGLADDEIYGQGFIAGTMFVARTSALNPLMALSIPDDEFEPEAGQIDGTLAHAVERAFALSVKASGMKIALSNHLVVGEDVRPNDRYAFV